MQYVFGYGSIINQHTRAHPSVSDVPVRVHGYARGWMHRIEQAHVTALGVWKDETSTCNGVLVEVSSELLQELDERELSVGYRREKIDWNCVTAWSGYVLPQEGDVYIYVTIEPQPCTAQYPIEQTYLDMVLWGCLQYGDEYTREFIETTDHWMRPVNDREQPLYPRWKPEYATDAVDAVMQTIRT